MNDDNFKQGINKVWREGPQSVHCTHLTSEHGVPYEEKAKEKREGDCEEKKDY